jgi:hypothetical protein
VFIPSSEKAAQKVAKASVYARFDTFHSTQILSVEIIFPLSTVFFSGALEHTISASTWNLLSGYNTQFSVTHFIEENHKCRPPATKQVSHISTHDSPFREILAVSSRILSFSFFFFLGRNADCPRFSFLLLP